MKRILLLLANGFEPMEAACFTDVIGPVAAHMDVNYSTT